MTNDETSIWSMLMQMGEHCYISPDGFTIYVANEEGLVKMIARECMSDKTDEEVNEFIVNSLKYLP